MLNPKVVLAPTDFSDAAEGALETAANVASQFGATLVLVHVVAALPKLPPDVSIFKEGDYELSLQAEATRRIGALSSKYAQAGISVQIEVGVANDVGMEIVRIAERHKADLIVIATHGINGWKAFAFGSVAEKIIRSTPSAVLLIKIPKGK